MGRKIERVRVSGALVSNESNALLTWARKGLGITRQPDWLVARDLKAGRLVSLLDEYLITQEARLPGIFAVFSRREFRPARVATFVDFLAAKIQASVVT